MVTFNRAARAYTGYPAQIFLARLDYGRGTQSHIEKLTILDKWYSALRAYLPVAFEKDLQTYNDRYAQKMIEIDSKLVEAWDLYDPLYEGESCNPNEKEYIRFMRSIMIDLDEATALSKVIDKQKMDEEGFDAT